MQLPSSEWAAPKQQVTPSKQEQLSSELVTSIKVLKETIKAKEKQLANLKNSIASTERVYKEKKDRLIAQQLEYEQSLAAHQRKVQMLMNDIGSATTKKQELQESKKSIQDEIKERKRYRSEQEKLIEATIEDGNLQLKSIGIEIKEVENLKMQMHHELLQLNNQKAELTDEIVAFNQHADTLERKIMLEERNWKEKLKQLQNKTEVAEKYLKEVTAETDRKMQLLKVQEISINAKRGALHKEQLEIAVARRRLENLQNLYE